MKIVDQSGSIHNMLIDMGFILSTGNTEQLTDKNISQSIVIGKSEDLKNIKSDLLTQALAIIAIGEPISLKGNVVGQYRAEPKSDNEKTSLKNLINTLCSLRDEKDKERFITSKLYERLLNIEHNSSDHSENLRKINRALIPKRFSNFKGVEIAARYQPGNRIGSEYYDAYFKGGKGIVLLVTSSSYLFSTIAISLFSQLKASHKAINKLYDQYLIDLYNEMLNIEGDFNLSLSLLMINSRDLSIEGFSSGEQLIGTSQEITHLEEVKFDQDHIKKKNVNIKLNPNEKFVLGSRGLARQIDKTDNYQVLRKIIDNTTYSSQDIADEVFLTLKTNENDFLEWDASILVLEATKNALYSI